MSDFCVLQRLGAVSREDRQAENCPKFRECISLGPHLFVKVPRPGDREVTFAVFESSCHVAVTTSLNTQR